MITTAQTEPFQHARILSIASVCLVGFVAQITLLSMVFFSSETTYDLITEYPHLIEPPAITLCFKRAYTANVSRWLNDEEPLLAKTPYNWVKDACNFSQLIDHERIENCFFHLFMMQQLTSPQEKERVARMTGYRDNRTWLEFLQQNVYNLHDSVHFTTTFEEDDLGQRYETYVGSSLGHFNDFVQIDEIQFREKHICYRTQLPFNYTAMELKLNYHFNNTFLLMEFNPNKVRNKEIALYLHKRGRWPRANDRKIIVDNQFRNVIGYEIVETVYKGDRFRHVCDDYSARYKLRSRDHAIEHCYALKIIEIHNLTQRCRRGINDTRCSQLNESPLDMVKLYSHCVKKYPWPDCFMQRYNGRIIQSDRRSGVNPGMLLEFVLSDQVQKITYEPKMSLNNYVLHMLSMANLWFGLSFALVFRRFIKFVYSRFD